MSKIADINEKVAQKVVQCYQKIENSAVGGYRKMEQSVVDGFEKVTDKCVDVLFSKEGESLSQTKNRLSGKKEED